MSLKLPSSFRVIGNQPQQRFGQNEIPSAKIQQSGFPSLYGGRISASAAENIIRISKEEASKKRK